MYGSSATWGFANVIERQKVKAFIRCSILAGFYTPDADYDFEHYYVTKLIIGCSTRF